ncbi:immunoglobulin domain-containing protein [bacterium]|nr:immunoglobulin domain-containing protein [candidate division CSSED10-310 bacterium]
MKITRISPNGEVTEQQTVTYQATLSGWNPQPNLTWNGTSGGAQYSFKAVTGLNSIKCIAYNPKTKRSKESLDSFEAKPLIIKPSDITISPVNPLIQSGESISLVCRVGTGTPDFKYSWSGPNGPLSTTSSTHPIANAQFTDDGKYTCEVSNAAGTGSATTELSVNRSPVFIKPGTGFIVPLGGTTTKTPDHFFNDPDGDTLRFEKFKPESDIYISVSTTDKITYTLKGLQEFPEGDRLDLTVTDGKGGICSGSTSYVVTKLPVPRATTMEAKYLNMK